VNDVLSVVLPAEGYIDHLKVSGSFTTKVGQKIYRINPVNCDGITSLMYLRHPDGGYLKGPMNDMDFKAFTDTFNLSIGAISSVPVAYRMFSRDADYPIVEVGQTPSEQSIISFEVIKKPKRISLATDYVMASDLVRLGATMMSKQDLGRDASLETTLFGQALSQFATDGANSSIGDVEV
jgi:hypothetical protein